MLPVTGAAAGKVVLPTGRGTGLLRQCARPQPVRLLARERSQGSPTRLEWTVVGPSARWSAASGPGLGTCDGESVTSAYALCKA
jgi:hypothetical protein